MASIINFLREQFTHTQPLPASTHHCQSRPDEPAYRLHLRMMPDGTGILIVNAATVLHLNPTATEYAFHMIKGTASDEAARQVVTQGGLATSKGEMWDARSPSLVHDRLPFLGGQLAVDALGGGVLGLGRGW